MIMGLRSARKFVSATFFAKVNLINYAPAEGEPTLG
jgi:hypothetical protein